MDVSLEQAEIQLGNGTSIRVINGVGATIACRDGSVWITQDSDPRDVLLRAGDAFTLNRTGLAIIEALDTARIHLEKPRVREQAAAWWRGYTFARSFYHSLAPNSSNVVAAC